MYISTMNIRNAPGESEIHGIELKASEHKSNWMTLKKIYIHVYIYSGYGKYSDPLTFFTLCYIAAIFFLINVHTAPHIARKTQNCWHFCRFIKKEKLKYHMVLSIQTLCCNTHIFNSGAVHFFWSSLRWFYTFIWVQLCLIKLIGLD